MSDAVLGVRACEGAKAWRYGAIDHDFKHSGVTEATFHAHDLVKLRKWR